MIKLRCPDCGVELETERKADGLTTIHWPRGRQVVCDPVLCPTCDDAPEMKVVRECPRCKGTSRKIVGVLHGPEVQDCSDCGGTGEILEEQP